MRRFSYVASEDDCFHLRLPALVPSNSLSSLSCSVSWHDFGYFEEVSVDAVHFDTVGLVTRNQQST